MPSVLQSASSQPGGKAYFVAHRAAQGKASSPFYSEVPSDSNGAATPSPAALWSRHEVLLSETSKPARPPPRRLNQDAARMTKTQFLTPARRGGAPPIIPARPGEPRGRRTGGGAAGPLSAEGGKGRGASETCPLRNLKWTGPGLWMQHYEIRRDHICSNVPTNHAANNTDTRRHVRAAQPTAEELARLDRPKQQDSICGHGQSRTRRTEVPRPLQSRGTIQDLRRARPCSRGEAQLPRGREGDRAG